ncbi:MAG: radical SAM protein [Candidatus Nealsonbacteria bacterium]|nr:MAG: radical SAM protein [Candidatus Nealsonbacteria bacterium]
MIRIENMEEAKRVSLNYGIPISEVLFCEFNRTGVWLELSQVPITHRVRFVCNDIFSDKSMYFALPVRERDETRFMVDKYGRLMFNSIILGNTSYLDEDTCDCSYFRKNKKVLNLNSHRRGECHGCVFCIHSYDITVLSDREEIIKKPKIREFFRTILEKNKFKDFSHFEQIAVVTGLFSNEKSVVQHIADVREVAGELNFSGTIFYLGCELTSRSALDEVKNYGPFSLCYSLDCLTQRTRRLTVRKRDVSVSSILQILEYASKLGLETTFSYIVGLDPIEDLFKGISELSQFVNRFPIVNIYQTQHRLQKKIMTPEADNLDYYLTARQIFESIFSQRGLRPHNWENYRSLWYHYFGDEYIPE